MLKPIKDTWLGLTRRHRTPVSFFTVCTTLFPVQYCHYNQRKIWAPSLQCTTVHRIENWITKKSSKRFLRPRISDAHKFVQDLSSVRPTIHVQFGLKVWTERRTNSVWWFLEADRRPDGKPMRSCLKVAWPWDGTVYVCWIPQSETPAFPHPSYFQSSHIWRSHGFCHPFSYFFLMSPSVLLLMPSKSLV